MAINHLFTLRSLLGAVALHGAATACLAQSSAFEGTRVTFHSQDPGGRLRGVEESPPVAHLEDGQWVFDGGGTILLVWDPSRPNAGLGTLDLHFEFQPWHQRLDDHWELVITPHPRQLIVRSLSQLTAPPGAQLGTALGLNRLEVLADGREQADAVARPLATMAGLDSWLIVDSPGNEGWATAPLGTGAWDLSVTQTLIGSYHLLPSADMDCQSTACMTGQRAEVSLDSLVFYLPQSVELRAITSNVPEPQVPALLSAGLLMLALRSGQRGARS